MNLGGWRHRGQDDYDWKLYKVIVWVFLCELDELQRDMLLNGLDEWQPAADTSTTSTQR